MSEEVENTIPVLRVSDVGRSRDFYVARLGFQVDWGDADDSGICQVSRDGHRIMLVEDDRLGSPGCVWIGLESDRLFREYVDRGVSVASPPANSPWAYEMRILDLDGNVLWLGTETKSPDAGGE